MNNSWIIRVQQELLGLRDDRPGWGNTPGGVPYVEVTALAALALAGSIGKTGADRPRAAVVASADWLASLQQSDGALGISAELLQPRWTTPLGILVWRAAGRDREAERNAVAWLLAHQGNTGEPVAGAFGHDPRIAGWPWVEGTHSWLEPTAMAVLALRRAGQVQHVRTKDGLRLIRDRAIRSGGWNYGNSTVFGADLRPHPSPTGLALLALAGIDDVDSPHIERSCAFLERILPTTRAPQSLCFGTLALAAWGRRPSAADDWIQSASARPRGRSNLVAQIAHLLLAAGPHSLEILGASAPAQTKGNES
jgi:hypothetical protein